MPKETLTEKVSNEAMRVAGLGACEVQKALNAERNRALEEAAALIERLEKYTLSRQYDGQVTDFQSSVNQGIRMSAVHFRKLAEEIRFLKTMDQA